jgi:molybdopterin molybdotransferase
MLTYDEAIEVILRTVEPLPPVECSLAEALGRVLAEPVEARWDLPPADNSAMDGFAVLHAGQSAGAELAIAGFIPAGSRLDGIISAGSAARIMTGAPLPDGTDTIVPWRT